MPIIRRLRINAPTDPVLVQGLADIRKKMHLPDALSPRVGETFPAIVTKLVDGDARTGTVMIADPAIETHVHADHDLPLGQRGTVKLLQADPSTRTVRFALE